MIKRRREKEKRKEERRKREILKIVKHSKFFLLVENGDHIYKVEFQSWVGWFFFFFLIFILFLFFIFHLFFCSVASGHKWWESWVGGGRRVFVYANCLHHAERESVCVCVCVPCVFLHHRTSLAS